MSLSREAWKEKIKRALELDLAYPFRAPREGTPSAVLLLLAHNQKGDLEILITKRTQSVDTHKGQYALPGGRLDEADHLEQGLITTALRETEEEVGVSRSQVEVLGGLLEMWTPSGFLISPVVGLAFDPVEKISLRVNPEEIDESFWVSISTLNRPGVYREEPRKLGLIEIKTDVFQVDHHKIWGATGAIIKNLIQRLDRIG